MQGNHPEWPLDTPAWTTDATMGSCTLISVIARDTVEIECCLHSCFHESPESTFPGSWFLDSPCCEPKTKVQFSDCLYLA